MAFDKLLKRRGRLAGRKAANPTFEYAQIIGENYADSVFSAPANNSLYGVNVDHGAPVGILARKRDGFESLFPSLGSGKVLGLHNWQHSTGDKLMMAWDKNLYLLSGESGAISKSSQEDWEEGTLTDVSAALSAGDIVLSGNFRDVVTVTADFDGTHENTVVASDKVNLADATTAVDQSNPDGPDWYHYFHSSSSRPGQTFKTGAGVIFIYAISAYLTCNTPGDVTLTLYRDTTRTANLGSSTRRVESSGFCVFAFAEPVPVTPGTTYFFELTTSTFDGRFHYTDNDVYGDGSAYLSAEAYSGRDFMFISHVPATGIYTHPAIDVSGLSSPYGIKINYNATTPAGTGVKMQTRVSSNNGDTWSAWATRANGDVFIAPDTDKTNMLVQWRAVMFSGVDGVTPSLDDVTVLCTNPSHGNWISPVYDLGNIPNQNNLTFTITQDADTSVAVYARGSSSGTVFGDWLEVINSGDSIPLQRYIQIMFVLETDDITKTPTVSDFVISYSTAYTKAHKMDVSPLGRVSDLLTGNRVRFCNYQDWLLMADGLRPFMTYITTDTQNTGTAQSAETDSITLESDASDLDGFYTNAFITVTDGPGKGQVRWITAYDGVTKKATISEPWSENILNNTSTYSISSALKVRNLGIDPPTVAPSGAAGDAGAPNGSYKLKVTYVNRDDVESNPSPESETVTVTSKKINWTIPVDSSVGNTTAKRRLYRTAAGGAVYKFLTEIADNTTTTYEDDIADAALDSLMLDNNNIPPLNVSLLYEFTSYVFYVDGYEVWFSKAGAPDQVPNIPGDIQQIAFPDEVLSIGSNTIALMFSGENFDSTITSNTGFVFDSDITVDTTTMKIIEKNGGLSQEATVPCLSPRLGSTLFRNTKTGIRLTRPGLQDNSVETEPESKNIQPYYQRSIDRDQAAGAFFNNYYLYSITHMPEDGGEAEYLTFAFDLRTEQWYGPWSFGMSCYSIVGNVLYAGDVRNGKVYRMFSGSSDDGEPIHMILDLPVRSPGGEAGWCKFHKMMAIVSNDSTTTETVIKPKVDSKEASIALGTLSDSFAGDKRPGHNFLASKKHRIPLQKGRTISYRIEDNSTNPLEIEKIVTEYEVLPINR